MELLSPAGLFPNGVGYNRFGRGRTPLVILQGLVWSHRPLRGWEALAARHEWGWLLRQRTVYLLVPRSGLSEGTTLSDMARDYAQALSGALPLPVDVIGTSTGGSVAQHLAADHPQVVRRLVLHGTGHTLSPRGKAAQLRCAALAARGCWRDASAALLEPMLPATPLGRLSLAIQAWRMSWGAPADAQDVTVTVQAEDAHAFADRLHEIAAPTLVIDGEEDGFYTPAILRETAAGIPNARLILYPHRNHGAPGPQLQHDILAFLQG
ncbi:MAG: alpha/beta fold hydrolase [Anaerolineae bacterium]|jgi:pimeloyl-ACP methyl ester carboxylesterase|nr:alpha/beta fold hydrolase [Chloroflexota bacterium]